MVHLSSSLSDLTIWSALEEGVFCWSGIHMKQFWVATGTRCVEFILEQMFSSGLALWMLWRILPMVTLKMMSNLKYCVISQAGVVINQSSTAKLEFSKWKFCIFYASSFACIYTISIFYCYAVSSNINFIGDFNIIHRRTSYNPRRKGTINRHKPTLHPICNE